MISLIKLGSFKLIYNIRKEKSWHFLDDLILSDQ